MVRHAQTIRQLSLTNCFSVFDHFVGLATKGLSEVNGYDRDRCDMVIYVNL